MQREVFKATAHGDLGTFGNARYKLMGQHEFPHFYDDEKDILLNADHDRYDLRRIYRDYNFRDVDLGENIARASTEIAFKVLKEIFSSAVGFDDIYKVVWTGYRVLGTLDRSNGYLVWSLSLFAKVNPETKVYSGWNAPNVEGYGKKDERGRLINDPFYHPPCSKRLVS